MYKRITYSSFHYRDDKYLGLSWVLVYQHLGKNPKLIISDDAQNKYLNLFTKCLLGLRFLRNLQHALG